MAQATSHPWRADRHMGARAPVRGFGRSRPLPHAPRTCERCLLPGANWFTTTRVGASDAIQSKQIMANEDPPVSLAPIWRDLPCFTRNDSICRSNRDHPVRIKTRQR
jgi:hypothetical protein